MFCKHNYSSCCKHYYISNPNEMIWWFFAILVQADLVHKMLSTCSYKAPYSIRDRLFTPGVWNKSCFMPTLLITTGALSLPLTGTHHRFHMKGWLNHCEANLASETCWGYSRLACKLEHFLLCMWLNRVSSGLKCVILHPHSPYLLFNRKSPYLFL